MSIFQSPEAKAKMVEWHGRFRDRIGVPTESRVLTTRLGESHALLCGPSDAPALVCLHGAISSSSHILREAAPMAERFRLIAPDIVGQSAMSAEVRPEINSLAYGEWLSDIFDALGVEEAFVFGASWGGLVGLRAAAYMPKRIRKLSLVVPAGIVQGRPIEGLFKAALPLALYRLFPTERRLQAFLHNLMTTHDEDWDPYLGQALRSFKLDFRMPRLLQEGDLAAFDAPVQVLAAELDIQFPGKPLLERVKKVIPNVVDTELMLETRHTPPVTDAFRVWMAERVGGFLLPHA